MKTTFVALTCAFALTHASPARSETAEPPDSWTHLKPGEEREGFAFTGEGTVHYKAALLGDCLRKDPKSGEIIVSAPSPKKHLRMVVCWDLDSGGLDAWVVNTG
ncbi:MAG TPA: hypothetical protein VMW75_19380, partial [Thermoanaerobaculia bacterium]|nr:hypothetical protein [Thermoanaerobaculia bacterium]